MQSRNVISVTLFIVLLIYGPIYGWTGGMVVRIAYLIVLPYGLWFLLDWIWGYFYIEDYIDNIIERITYSLIGLFLIIRVFIEITAKNHLVNTMWIQTRDGSEAVGDDILVPGPDYHASFAFFALGLIVVVVAAFVRKKEKKQDRFS